MYPMHHTVLVSYACMREQCLVPLPALHADAGPRSSAPPQHDPDMLPPQGLGSIQRLVCRRPPLHAVWSGAGRPARQSASPFTRAPWGRAGAAAPGAQQHGAYHASHFVPEPAPRAQVGGLNPCSCLLTCAHPCSLLDYLPRLHMHPHTYSASFRVSLPDVAMTICCSGKSRWAWLQEITQLRVRKTLECDISSLHAPGLLAGTAFRWPAHPLARAWRTALCAQPSC